jgi:hypothetical protein
MKRLSWGWVFAAALLASGCRDDAKEAGGSSSSVRKTPGTAATRAVDEGAGKDCEAYVAALQQCVNQMPAATRGPMEKQLEAQQTALKNASPAEKQSMDSGCRNGLAALKQNPACQL